MKKISITKVKRITDQPYIIVKRDNLGRALFKNNNPNDPETKETTDLLEILEHFILYNIPSMARDKYTRLDGIRVSNIYKSIKSVKNGILELDEPEHNWLKEKIGSDDIGAKVFLHDLTPLEDALDNFERKHQPKGKEEQQEGD